MPKIIAELRQDILSQARETLFSQGYEALTIRGVASACHIAVGTVYNYFPSKDMLVAQVILADWLSSLEEMKAALPAPTATAALKAVFRCLMVFYDRYTVIWKEYTAAGHIAPITGAYHRQLVEQLEGVIDSALVPFGPLCSPALPGFLAETLLNAASAGLDRFGEILPILDRLL